jgi:predicted RNA-binding protein YlxR (DUF448 family)/ribosomal protein L30E
MTHEDEDRPTNPARTCAGCRRVDAKEELLRFAVAPVAPFLIPDIAGKLGGRGVSVHPTRACLESAVRRGGFARALKRAVPCTVDELASLAAAQFERRAASLIVAARRAGALVVGTDAVREAMREATVAALVVASDAAGRRAELEGAAARLGKRCVVHGTKASLGRLLGRDEVGVVAVLDVGIASALARAAARGQALLEAE